MKKRRIVLASVLKPIDDTRMLEKLGTTLASAYEVYIIGQPAKETITDNSINFVPLPATHRLSLQRLLAPWRVLLTVLRVRPDLLIVCTAELLPMALCVRLLSRVKVVYDIQENYVLNLLHGDAWPRVVRRLLASAVRMFEWLSSPMISHYLLAEKSYANELAFIGRKFTVVENKAVHVNLLSDRQSPGPSRANSQDVRLLFSGTLADTTGVFDAIDLSIRLHETNKNITLHVIGYAAKADVRVRLMKVAADHPFIHLEGIDHLVPHREILQAINAAHFGIISYPRNPSTWSAYPTKLYEYLGYRLPVLLTSNPYWVNYCASYNAAVVFDPSHIVVDELLAEMKDRLFYTKDPDDVFWEDEAPKLLQSISPILSPGPSRHNAYPEGDKSFN